MLATATIVLAAWHWLARVAIGLGQCDLIKEKNPNDNPRQSTRGHALMRKLTRSRRAPAPPGSPWARLRPSFRAGRRLQGEARRPLPFAPRRLLQSQAADALTAPSHAACRLHAP